jgi:PTS system galactitol-specific IIA component
LNDKNYFSTDLIEIGLDVKSDFEVISRLSLLLYRKGYVKESFSSAAIEREKVYATGLPCELCGIAIPHTDPVHVNKMAIAIGVLKNPIQFGMMGGSETIDVDLVFLLALEDCDSQIRILKRFADFFQKDKELSIIRSASSPEQILQVMEQYFYPNNEKGKLIYD